MNKNKTQSRNKTQNKYKLLQNSKGEEEKELEIQKIFPASFLPLKCYLTGGYLGVYIYMKIKGNKTYSSYQPHFKCSPHEEAFNTGLKIGKHLTCSKRGRKEVQTEETVQGLRGREIYEISEKNIFSNLSISQIMNKEPWKQLRKYQLRLHGEGSQMLIHKGSN